MSSVLWKSQRFEKTCRFHQTPWGNGWNLEKTRKTSAPNMWLSMDLCKVDAQMCNVYLPTRPQTLKKFVINPILRKIHHDVTVHHDQHLVGGWPTPLKNIKVSLRWLFPIYGKIKCMFQTTNQALNPNPTFFWTFQVLGYPHDYMETFGDWKAPNDQPPILPFLFIL